MPLTSTHKRTETQVNASFPTLGNHTLVAVSECGRFGLYRADRFGKRGPAAQYEYAVADAVTGKSKEMPSKTWIDCWVAKVTSGAECAPYYQSSPLRAPKVRWVGVAE